MQAQSSLPPKGHILAATVRQTKTEFQGPLPPPEVLAHYEQVSPGFAERIVRMAEQQASHRQSLEKQVVEAQVADAQLFRSERRLGQVFALLVTLSIALVGGYVALHGAPWPGALLGSSGLSGIVVAFLSGGRNGSSQPTTDKPKPAK